MMQQVKSTLVACNLVVRDGCPLPSCGKEHKRHGSRAVNMVQSLERAEEMP